MATLAAAQIKRASLDDYLLRANEQPLLRFTTAGSVDDGKSTLIGRLLHDSKAILEDQLAAIQNSKVNRAAGALDLSLLTDGLRAEREQGITIDVAYRHFATPRRRFLIADTPGHAQYTRNMATGASTADAAVILIDARHGLTEQSRRHAFIAWQLGIRHLVIAVNKMDLVGFDAAVFDAIQHTFRAAAAQFAGSELWFVPVSALEGDNIVERSARTPWYNGPALLELLETLDVAAAAAPFRFAVQYVVRPDLDFRGYAGRIESGTIAEGDRVIVLPSGRETRIERIVTFDGDLERAIAPMSVTLTLADEIDIARGDWLVQANDAPHLSRTTESTVVWMHDRPLEPGSQWLIRHGSDLVNAKVTAILHRVDLDSFEPRPAAGLGLNEIGRVRLETTRPLVFDEYRRNRATGALVFVHPIENYTAGAAMIERNAAPDQRRATSQSFELTPLTLGERIRRHGHQPAIVKAPPTLIPLLERALFEHGAAVIALDQTPAIAPQLLAAGLLILVPNTDAHSGVTIAATDPHAALAELEKAGILAPRDIAGSGEGI
jgi:sulfate adenylyltransferase large subunit